MQVFDRETDRAELMIEFVHQGTRQIAQDRQPLHFGNAPAQLLAVQHRTNRRSIDTRELFMRGLKSMRAWMKEE